jgi:hypothetical protein
MPAVAPTLATRPHAVIGTTPTVAATQNTQADPTMVCSRALDRYDGIRRQLLAGQLHTD